MLPAHARLLFHKTIWSIFIILLLCCTAFTPQPVQAAGGDFIYGPGWIVVASQDDVVDPDLGDVTYNSIYTINTETNEKHGPFLRDDLNQFDPDTEEPLGGNLLDVAMTPDGKTALISDFSQWLIYFVDLTDPLAPAFLGSVEIGMFAEDIAITHDGRFALVSDGGFAASIYSIDINTRQVVQEFLIPIVDHDDVGDPIYGYANAVDIAPDGTVIAADYYGGSIHYMVIDENGRLSYYGSHRYYLSYDGEVSLTPDGDSSAPLKSNNSPSTNPDRSSPAAAGSDDPMYHETRPINISIAPDGQTVLVPNANNYADNSLEQYEKLYSIGVYRITAPGTLEFVEAVTGLTHCSQTITFTEAGDLAVMSGNGGFSYDAAADPTTTYRNDGLYVMKILGPGDVEFDADHSTDLLRCTGSQLFGVDGLAVYNGKAYITYATAGIEDDAPFTERYVSVVDLETFELTQIDWGLRVDVFPAGLGVRPYIPERMYVPLMQK